MKKKSPKPSSGATRTAKQLPKGDVIHRVAIRAWMIFDLRVPRSASLRKARQGAREAYLAAMDNVQGFNLPSELPDCRVYADTRDGYNPTRVDIEDTREADAEGEE